VAGAIVGGARSAPSEPDVPDLLAGRSQEQQFLFTVAGQLFKENCVSMVMLAVVMTSLAMLGIVAAVPPAPTGGAGPRRRRRHYALRVSVRGVVGGILAGLGGLVLLQQYGVLYPTQGVAIAAVVGGGVFGVALPTIARFFALRRASRRFAAAEDGR
jgi:hypothetical protein